MLDAGDVSDICKHLASGIFHQLYPACKIYLSLISTSADGVTSGLPQPCFDLNSPAVEAPLYAGVGTALSFFK